MRVTVLGCGGSGGVPLIGGDLGKLQPGQSAKPAPARLHSCRRRRGSRFWSMLRPICASNCWMRTSSISMPFCSPTIMPTIATASTICGSCGRTAKRLRCKPGPRRRLSRRLRERFGYIFRQNEAGSGVLYRPFLAAHGVAGPFNVGGLKITPFEQQHGLGSVTTGYRIGRMAYSTDVVALDEAAFAVLAGLDLWIVDCLRFEPHPTHAHFDLTMSWIERAQAEARAADPSQPHDRLRRSGRAVARPGWSPPMTGSASRLGD